MHVICKLTLVPYSGHFLQKSLCCKMQVARVSWKSIAHGIEQECLHIVVFGRSVSVLLHFEIYFRRVIS